MNARKPAAGAVEVPAEDVQLRRGQAPGHRDAAGQHVPDDDHVPEGLPLQREGLRRVLRGIGVRLDEELLAVRGSRSRQVGRRAVPPTRADSTAASSCSAVS